METKIETVNTQNETIARGMVAISDKLEDFMGKNQGSARIAPAGQHTAVPPLGARPPMSPPRQGAPTPQMPPGYTGPTVPPPGAAAMPPPPPGPNAPAPKAKREGIFK